MSQRKTPLLVLLAFLAACGGNPFVDGGISGGDDDDDDGGSIGDDDDDDDDDGGTDFTTVNKDLRGVQYDAATGALLIDMQGVSSSGQYGIFNRAPAMDIPGQGGQPGYMAYVFQETALTRSYLAYVATNARGNLVAVASADGGQFNEHNGGGRWMRVDSYTRPVVAGSPTPSPGPESGTFSYMGSYAAVFVPGPSEPGNPRPDGLEPGMPWNVQGTIQINAQFATAASGETEVIEGGVSDRILRDHNGNQITSVVLDNGDGTTTVIDTTSLPDIVLRETVIDSSGQFLGDVEFLGAPGNDIGDYAGAFGGSGATDVAGVLWLNPIQGQSGIWEYGAFNLPRCDLAGASPLCVPR